MKVDYDNLISEVSELENKVFYLKGELKALRNKQDDMYDHVNSRVNEAIQLPLTPTEKVSLCDLHTGDFFVDSDVLFIKLTTMIDVIGNSWMYVKPLALMDYTDDGAVFNILSVKTTRYSYDEDNYSVFAVACDASGMECMSRELSSEYQLTTEQGTSPIIKLSADSNRYVLKLTI